MHIWNWVAMLLTRSKIGHTLSYRGIHLSFVILPQRLLKMWFIKSVVCVQTVLSMGGNSKLIVCVQIYITWVLSMNLFVYDEIVRGLLTRISMWLITKTHGVELLIELLIAHFQRGQLNLAHHNITLRALIGITYIADSKLVITHDVWAPWHIGWWHKVLSPSFNSSRQ